MDRLNSSMHDQKINIYIFHPQKNANHLNKWYACWTLKAHYNLKITPEKTCCLRLIISCLDLFGRVSSLAQNKLFRVVFFFSLKSKQIPFKQAQALSWHRLVFYDVIQLVPPSACILFAQSKKKEEIFVNFRRSFFKFWKSMHVHKCPLSLSFVLWIYESHDPCTIVFI